MRRVAHCSHWGAYTLLVEDGRILRVEPFDGDPAPSPVIHSVSEWATSARRVTQPLVREGWLSRRDRAGRGSDRFIPVGWDEAEALVAGEIARVAAEHGNAAIFAGSYGWTSCGRFHHAPSLLKRLLNLVGGYTGHVDTYSIAAGPVILRHVLGSDEACGGGANTLDSIAEHAQTLVVFGALSPRTAQNEAGGLARHALETHLRRIVERGVKVILVSPLRDDLPDWVEAEWWPIRPNTDTALMLGLAAEIVRAGRHDAGFLARCTSGSDRFLASLCAKGADWAAGITGLDAGAIRALAARLVDSRSMLTVSWSLQRAHHGEQPFWAALGLACVIGQIGLPGGGVGYGYGSLGGVGAPQNMGRSPAMPQGRRPIDSFIPVARIADMLLNPGAPFTYQGEERRYPDTRLVYWAGGNPFHHHQDLNRLARAWDRPETIIVQDPMFTPTAERADIVLPASTSLERNDIAGNRRMDMVLAMQQAIAPVGQARSDYDIFAGLAARLGVGAAFTEGRDEMGWLRHLYDITRQDARERLAFEMPDFDAFWAAGRAACPVRANHVYLAGFRADPEALPLATESGRIVLGSETLARLGHADCPDHPEWIPPHEWLGGAGAEEFHLVSHQPAGRLHSQLDTGPASLAEKRGGREQARMAPEDASRIGAAEGDVVRLWNTWGACLATLAVDDRVAPGVVVLPTGAWFLPRGNEGLDVSGNPNVLTPDIPTSAFGQGCSAHTCLVRVEPWSGPAPDAMQAWDERLAAVAAE